MGNFTVSKVVSALPATLTNNTIYYVRVGTGYDEYVTNDLGAPVAYKVNQIIPTGGTIGQVLAKNSATNYDFTWATAGAGSGDMLKSAYDTTASGNTVNNSRALGGVAAASYAVVSSINTFIAGQIFTGSLRMTALGALPAAGVTGTVHYFSNEVYYDNGLAILKLSNQLPLAGTTGQALVKVNNGDLAVGWGTVGNVVGAGTSVATGIATFNNVTGTLLAAPMLAVTSTGALQTFGVGSGTIVGNARGVGAVDLQISRTAATMVASGANSGVLGGTNNSVAGATSTVVGGTDNVMLGTGVNNVISGGALNNIAAGSNHSIGGGNNNIISLANGNGTILNGSFNTINNAGSLSLIGSGYNNNITSTGSGYNSILGGANNAISGAATHSFVGGGISNTLNGATGVIAGGSSHTIIAAATFGFIGGGFTNRINNAAATHSVIVGGNNNTVNALYSFIGGGNSNNISAVTGNSNVITGGASNVISSTGGSNSIVGGSLGTISGTGGGGTLIGGISSYVTATLGMAQGKYAVASLYGQRAFANERFAANGDAQMAMYNLMASTASATAVVMTLDGVSPATAANALTIAAAQSKYMYINVLAQSTLAATVTGIASWEIKVLIARTVGVATTVIIGTPTNVLLASAGTITGWAVTIAADTTLGSLRLTVTTGAAVTPVKWLATIEGTEIIF